MLKFKRDDIADCFSRAARVAGRKDGVRSKALIEAENGRATITAVDDLAEIGIRLQCSCDGPNLRTMVPCQLTANFLKSFTEDSVSAEIVGNSLRLTDGPATFEPEAGDPDSFTGWTTPGNEIRLTASTFSAAVNRVAWAAESEAATRYALSGVHLQIKGGKCRLAATDSRCLAVEYIEVDSEAEWEGVVPTLAITFAASLMVGDFDLCYGENSVEFRGVDSHVYARLVQGRFPKVADVIPKDDARKLDLTTSDILRVVRQSLLVMDKDSTGAMFTVEDARLLVDARSEGKGHAAVGLPVACDFKAGVTLDAKFLERFLSRLDGGDRLTWHMNPLDANKFTIQGRDFVVVIMPRASE